MILLGLAVMTLTSCSKDDVPCNEYVNLWEARDENNDGIVGHMACVEGFSDAGGYTKKCILISEEDYYRFRSESFSSTCWSTAYEAHFNRN